VDSVSPHPKKLKKQKTKKKTICSKFTAGASSLEFTGPKSKMAGDKLFGNDVA
jgi:hypothetical protein